MSHPERPPLRPHPPSTSRACQISSIECGDDDDKCHNDKCFTQGPLFVNIYLVFNIGYNILIIFILK